ncbi:hypothetical protein ACFRU3_43265, partial [Streptomyces sp. NPDC056910]
SWSSTVFADCGAATSELSFPDVLLLLISASSVIRSYTVLFTVPSTRTFRSDHLIVGLGVPLTDAQWARTEPYFLFLEGDMDNAVMALGSVTGVRPNVAWGAAPWFGDARFLSEVSAEALAEACLRTLNYGHDLDTDEMRDRCPLERVAPGGGRPNGAGHRAARSARLLLAGSRCWSCCAALCRWTRMSRAPNTSGQVASIA